MYLNRKDKETYNKFVNETQYELSKNNNDQYDKYIPILLKFIIRHYNSDKSSIYDLEDFINGAIMIIDHVKNYSCGYPKNYGCLMQKLNLKFNKMFDETITENSHSAEIDIYEIDDSIIDYEALVELVKSHLPSKYSIIIDDFFKDETLAISAKIINGTTQLVNEMRKKSLNSFSKYYSFKQFIS